MTVEVGQVFDGKVTGILAFGAFVDIGEGKSGMVHISEVANTFVQKISDHLTIGQQVRVKVIGINADGKISLSIKKADAAPPVEAAENAPARPPREPRPQSSGWQGPRGDNRQGQQQSFEDMMSRFKQTSDDKMSALRKSGDSRYSGNKGKRK
ncbi:MAG: S1 RNA-binding domain-containing protein [Oscillospiraceae bacterium]|jgi:S1 RNA binding domain protein|nr:S1 RNA-binding domain-containing protein [Oscillospiraceae bacterium]